jgi:hypothetical protein
MKTKLFVITVACVLMASISQGHSSYIFTTIVVPGSAATDVGRINNAGQIAGIYTPLNAPGGFGFLGSGGAYTTLNGIPLAPCKRRIWRRFKGKSVG